VIYEPSWASAAPRAGITSDPVPKRGQERLKRRDLKEGGIERKRGKYSKGDTRCTKKYRWAAGVIERRLGKSRRVSALDAQRRASINETRRRVNCAFDRRAVGIESSIRYPQSNREIKTRLGAASALRELERVEEILINARRQAEAKT